MKKSLNQKPCASKTIRRFLAVLLAGAMLIGLCACAEQKSAEIKPVTVEREPGPQALQAANQATALALRQYIYARLKTEEFAEADFASLSMDEIAAMTEETAAAWETADALAAGAEAIIDQAIVLLKDSSDDQNTDSLWSQAQAIPFIAKGPDFSTIPLANGEGKQIDPKTWAENLTKQYDALRGAQRYKQLAEQMGTDTKTAVEQMALAQEIIHSQAVADADFWDKMTKAAQATKTACKVGLFVGATVATGGGSLASLAGSSMTVAKAGAVIVGGVDCIVDIGTTASTIVLGENHQVTMDFEKIGDVLQPISMVVGLATMDPGETVEKIALVGESVMEWFCPGKITGIVINPMKKGYMQAVAKLIEVAENNTSDTQEALETALEALGLSLPSGKDVTLENLMQVYTANATTSLASMEALAAQIGVQDWEAPTPDLQPQEIEPQATEEPNPSDAQPPKELMSVEEFEALDIYFQSEVAEIFGEPDATVTDEGHTVWLYFDRLQTSSEATYSIRFVFYTRDDVIEWYRSMGIEPDEEQLAGVRIMIIERRYKEVYLQKYNLQ